MCDKMRNHSLVAFLVHFSVFASVLCAFVAFLAGIEQALDNMVIYLCTFYLSTAK